MITAWLIYDAKGAHHNQSYIEWFILEAKKQQLNLKLILREALQIGVHNHKPIVLLNQKEVDIPQVAIVRMIDPLLSKQLEIIGVKVFNNSEVATLCNHKGLTHQYMSTLGIPMVATYFYQNSHLPATPPSSLPFIIKNVHGKGGQEVFLINNHKEWLNVKEHLAEEVIIQNTNVQLGKDLRVYVLGNKILAAVLRENKTSFKANFTLGGSARIYELQEHEKTLINNIIAQFDFDFIGIDFLISLQGDLLFNEIEDVVGSRMLSELTDINVLEKYVKHIIGKISHVEDNSQ